MDLPKASFSLSTAPAKSTGPTPSVDSKPRLNTPYDVFRRALKNYWVGVGMQALCFIVYILVGCAYYHHVEGWSFGTCFMFTIVTISTVGYGYQYPTTDNARIFTMFYIIVGVYFIFFSVSNAIAAHFEAVKAYVEERVATGNIGQNINRHKYAFGCILVSIFLCLFVGGAIFQTLEGWSFVEGLYFAVETSTTVGYGDLDINNEPSTYLFVIFYIVFSTVLFAFAFNTFNLIQEELKQMEKEEEILARKQEMGFIADLDKGNGVTEGQFILAVLEHLGTLNFEKDVKPWQEKFRELDIQGVGKVNHQALESLSHRESIAASDRISRIHNLQNSNQSGISSLFRPSVMSSMGGEIRSPFARETLNSADLAGRDRLTMAQASLLSHYV